MMKYTLALLGALVLAVAGLGGQVEPLGIVVEPPEPDALTVRVWMDKPLYQVGDTARVHFEINKPAFIYIWSIDRRGEVNRIFPNPFDTQNYFSEAGEYTVPTPGKTYELRVIPPTGTDWVQILAVEEPIPFEQLGEDPETLGAEVLGLIPEPVERAFDFTSFEIVDRAPPPAGTLTVRSTPSLAQVYIDGVLRGWTPLARDLAPGSYTVLVRKSGYQDETRTVTIQSGRTRSLTVSLTPIAVNEPPVAEFDYDPSEPEPGQWVQFDASASFDPDGHIVSYQWDFTGDGAFDRSGRAVWWRFDAPGTYPVRLVVTDNEGARGERTREVIVGAVNEPPVAEFDYDPSEPEPGQWVQFDASASFDPDGHIVSYQWDFTGDGAFDRSGRVVFWRFDAPGAYPVRLVVTDNEGATGGKTHTVEVGIVVPTPPGMPDMGATPGIYVWGTDKWNITVNGAPGWGTPRGYVIELRTDGSFVDVGTDAALAPLGLVPEPIDEGWRIVFEGEVGTGKITHTFRLSGASSLWMDLRLDMDGDGTPDRSIGIARLRQQKVAAPFNPVVLGVPTGHTGPFVPTVNFRIGNPFRYDRTFRIVFWGPNIGDLESP